MQNPTGQAGTSTPTETVVAINSLNLNRTFTVRRKAAKRSERWYQNTAAPLSFPAIKKPRLEERLPKTADEAKKSASLEGSVGLPPPIADNDNADASTDSVICTQPNATGRWTPEEDAELTSAFTNTRKKKHGKEHNIDWVAVATLVTRRSKKQCWSRWKDSLDPISINLTAGRKGKWVEDEDIKQKAAVQAHGDNDWVVITALVPGRTKKQCRNRWHHCLDPSLERANGCTGNWTEDEDTKLKRAVKMHGGKGWDAIAALVPGRAKKQCHNRWHLCLDPSLERANGCTGRWTSVEDSKLEDVVKNRGCKSCDAIASLVPGRTKVQCRKRWRHALNPNIHQANGRSVYGL